MIGIAEILLGIVQLPAVRHVQAGDFTIEGLDPEGNPVIFRYRDGQKAEQ